MQTSVGKMELHKAHILTQSPTEFAISSYTQELMCYTGQHLVFAAARNVIQTFLGIDINAKQIERICHKYGQWIEEEDLQLIKKMGKRAYSKKESEALHYASVDGSMYLTREEDWKEIKLGRIFKAADIVGLSKKRNEVMASTYVGHLGNHTDFLPKMEYHLDGLKNVVFIADGAKWIWNWVEDFYPDSIQILDFFHAKEHLCNFAKEYYLDEKTREDWVESQSKCLKEKQVSEFIKNIEELPPSPKLNVENNKRILLEYYKNHKHRMRYKEFLEQGLLIGSGAMEAAHKNVLQHRLKLSGQRWTMEGLQQMTQLRVVHKSNQWHRVKRLAIKNVA